MPKIKYVLERTYPYFVSGLIVIGFYNREYNFADSNHMPNAIEGIITVAALIIGFIGTMLPILFAVQKDSEFVKSVLKSDTEHLLLKYLRAMLLSGLLLIVLSVLLNFVTEVPGGILSKYGFYGWIFLLSCFVLTTYRCISRMLRLVFEDGKKPQKRRNIPEKTQRESDFEKRLREKEKM